MKTDISNREDIHRMTIQFYEKVKKDDVIGFIFNDVVKMNWEKHIPVIVDFWESILLDNPVYQQNAMEKHFHLNNMLPLQKEHFDRWLLLFTTTVDEMFEGKIATLAKIRAKSISDVMHFKMKSIQDNNTIL